MSDEADAGIGTSRASIEDKIEEARPVRIESAVETQGSGLSAVDRPQDPVAEDKIKENEPTESGRSESRDQERQEGEIISPEDGQDSSSGMKRRNSDEDQSRKRLRIGTQAEEKRRGQRLFGSLLGTLGGIKKEATSAKAQERAARQSELEQRQRERAQKAAEEMAQKRAEDEALRIKQERARKQAMAVKRQEAREAHQVVLAGYLVTKNKPQLYYLPWKLTLEQEAKIEAQIKVAKAEIAKASPKLTAEETVGHATNDDTEMKDSLNRQSPKLVEVVPNKNQDQVEAGTRIDKVEEAVS